jgi:hypothetical protein
LLPCRAWADRSDPWILDGDTWHSRPRDKIDDAALGALVARSKREKIIRLRLSGNGPTEISPAGWRQLGALSDLAELDVGETSFPAAAIEILADLPKLTRLSLRHLALRATDLSPLGRSATLRSLDLSEIGIADAPLPELHSLRELSLDNTLVGGQTIASLTSSTPELEKLNLSGTPVRGPQLAPLRGLVRLRDLVLEYTKIGNQDLRYLSDVRSLRSVDVSSTRVRGTKSRFLPAGSIHNWTLRE